MAGCMDNFRRHGGDPPPLQNSANTDMTPWGTSYGGLEAFGYWSGFIKKIISKLIKGKG